MNAEIQAPTPCTPTILPMTAVAMAMAVGHSRYGSM